MKKYLILLLTMAVMAWGGEVQHLSANEEGHHEKKGSGHMDQDGGHDESDEHSQESSKGSKAMMTKKVDNYQYVLSISPEYPRSGEETELEFEIMDMRGAEDNFGDGFPVTDVEVAVRIKELTTNQQKTVHAHGEGDAGVYGVHYVFPSAGSYQISLEWEDANGKKIMAHFDIENVEQGSKSHESEEDHHDEEEEDSHGGGDHH